ncbi:hypothetical protein M0805_000270 [Coniferiporia weirii]|nr:hypothetical protein M0805_000270 [Coniferiporia weirii]
MFKLCLSFGHYDTRRHDPHRRYSSGQDRRFVNLSNTPLSGSNAFKTTIDNGMTWSRYSVVFEDDFELIRGGRPPGALGGNGSEADKTRAPTASTTGAPCDVPRAHLPSIHLRERRHAVHRPGYNCNRRLRLSRSARVLALQRKEMNILSAVDSEIRMWIDGNEGVTLYNVALRDDENATIQAAASDFLWLQHQWLGPAERLRRHRPILNASPYSPPSSPLSLLPYFGHCVRYQAPSTP